MYKILLITTLLVASLAGISQDIPKGSNAIKLKDATFKSVVTALLDAGYQFKSLDSNFGLITTDPKKLNNRRAWVLQIVARQKNTDIILTGFCAFSEMGFNNNDPMDLLSGKSPVAYRGMKGSLQKESFEKLLSFAVSTGLKFEYLTIE